MRFSLRDISSKKWGTVTKLTVYQKNVDIKKLTKLIFKMYRWSYSSTNTTIRFTIRGKTVSEVDKMFEVVRDIYFDRKEAKK